MIFDEFNETLQGFRRFLKFTLIIRANLEEILEILRVYLKVSPVADQDASEFIKKYTGKSMEK